MELFNSLDPVLKTFWIVTIPTSIIFLIQTAMTFLGTDAGDGLDADFDGDLDGDHGHGPFQLFTLRNLINFLLGFGWSGIALYSTIPNTTVLYIVATLVGILFLVMFLLITLQLRKLAEDNTFRTEETIDKTAEVYLTIPEQKSGRGKVLVSVRGSVREMDAMTSGERIPSGGMVRIVGVEQNLLIVEPIL